jgi:chemotaxis protein methyltransferase CheR
MTRPPISAADYQFLCTFLREQIGYELGGGKEYLVESRLQPIAASLELDSVVAVVERLRLAGEHVLREAVIEAMVTHETSFFRTGRTFENLRNVIIPALRAARSASRQLRIWCAGCATGQEPYSVVMTLTDHFAELGNWRIDILATDVSDRILERARAGVYNQFEVQRGLPVQSLLKHFRQVGTHWQIADELRRLVGYRKFNLLDPFTAIDGPYDVVFLCNVLIYFDPASKGSIFAKLRRAIAPDGFLVLGESETVLGLTDQFRITPEAAGVFRPADHRR